MGWIQGGDAPRDFLIYPVPERLERGPDLPVLGKHGPSAVCSFSTSYREPKRICQALPKRGLMLKVRESGGVSILEFLDSLGLYI